MNKLRKKAFVNIYFLALAILTCQSLYGSKRTNNDVVSGRLIEPGPWEFFIYHTMDLAGSIDLGSAESTIEELGQQVSDGGEAKDADVLDSFANANLNKFIVTYHEKRKEFEKSFTGWLNSGKNGERPVFKLGDEKSYLQKALSSFRHLIFDFPKDKHSADLYFKLSLILSLSRNDNTRIYLQKIFKVYPKSELKDLALLLLANHFFEKQKFKEAFKTYRKLFRSPDNKVRLYAKYMSSWIYYLKNKKKKNLFAKKLTEVVRIGLIQGDSMYGSYIIDESLSDLVKIWDQPGFIEQAGSFFNRVQKPQYYLMTLERVGNRQIKEKKFQQASNIFQKIITTSAIKSNNPQIHETILKLAKVQKKSAMIVNIFKQMEKLYLQDSPWTMANKDHVDSAKKLMENSIKSYAVYLNKLIEKKSKRTILYPIELLEMYLKWFGESPVALKMRLKLAQLQSMIGMHMQAGTNFKKISDQTDEKSELKYNSFKIALSEIKKAVWNQKTIKPGEEPPLAAPALIPNQVKMFVDLLEEYRKKYNENEHDIAMQAILAEIYYDYGHYKLSEEVWKGIVSNKIKGKLSEVSIIKLLNFYHLTRNWSELLSYGFAQHEANSINDKKMKDLLLVRLHEATLESGKQKTAEGKLDEAIASFLKYQKSFPAGKDSDLFLQNSFLLTGKKKDVVGQIGLGNLFVKTYPNSKYLDGLLIELAGIHERLLDLDLAAVTLTFFVSKFPKDTRVPDSVWKTAEYFKATDNIDKSTAVYFNFIKNYPASPKINDAYTKLFELLRETKNTKLLTGLAAKYLSERHKKTAGLTALSKVYVGISKNQPVPSLVSMIAPLPEADKNDAAEVLSDYLMINLKAMVQTEISRELDFSQDIKKLSAAKKAQFKQFEEIGKQAESLGRADKVIDIRYRLAILYSGFARKLSARIKTAKDDDKIVIENIAFESQEVAEKYFELIHELMPRVLAFEGKQVYEGMGEYKKKYKTPREFGLKPDFASLIAW